MSRSNTYSSLKSLDVWCQDKDPALDLDTNLMSISIDFDEVEIACNEFLFEDSIPPVIDENACMLLMDVLWRLVEASEGQSDYQALEGFTLLLEIVAMQRRVKSITKGEAYLAFILICIRYNLAS